jgi:outer membrane protein assembly factor BamD (BamD/ComL family)
VLFASEEEDFTLIKNKFHSKEWNLVLSLSSNMLKAYPESVFAKDIYFFRAAAYFYKDDPDLSNQMLGKFLEKEGGSAYFEEALGYKYFIAEKFENGYYGHLFGVSALPRIESMWETAYQLYDEVILTIPRSEIAAKSLFRKACMYAVDEKFEESIETFNTLIRKFSRNSLSQKAYIEIAKVYKKQIKALYLDPKSLEFALINQKRFNLDYPSSKFKDEMEKEVNSIIDLYAEDVYKSALYFDKKNEKESAIMYYKSLVAKYPKSKFSSLALEKVASYEAENIMKKGLSSKNEPLVKKEAESKLGVEEQAAQLLKAMAIAEQEVNLE